MTALSKKIVVHLVAVFFLAAACRQDIGLLLRDKRDVSGNGPSPTVKYLVPADASDGIGTNIKISVVFSTAMGPDSVHVSTTGTACSGTIQLSADNFASCVPMAAQPTSADAGSIFTLTPAAALAANTLYKTRITTGVRSAENTNMAAVYATPQGFRTGPGADARAPIGPQAARFVVPYDAATAVGTNTQVLVYFLEPVLPSTVLLSTAGSQCSGSIRLSRDNFATCVPFMPRPEISSDGKIYTLVPATSLDASTVYRIATQASITDLAGNAFAGFVSTFTTGTGPSGAAATVAGAVPNDNAANVSINASYQITLNRAINPATLNLNFETTVCTGAIQVSMNGFSSCIPWSTRVLISEGFNDIYLFPRDSLAVGTTYRLRVTSELRDTFGDSVTAYTQPNGFTTGNPTSPVVEHLIAFDGSTLGSLFAPFGVTFSKIMNPATITVNTVSTSCTGGYSFQVSADNFTTCLRMAAVTANATNSRFLAYPVQPLTPNTVYRTRLTIGAQDAGGIANTLFTGSGITTEP